MHFRSPSAKRHSHGSVSAERHSDSAPAAPRLRLRQGAGGCLKLRTQRSRTFEAELADMKPQAFELGRNPDGRIYYLSLVPGVEVTKAEIPEPLSTLADKQDDLLFVNSNVIRNENDYLGTILYGSGGELGWIEVAGWKRVEFALIPFRDARKMGTLKDGKLSITGDDNSTLDIYNVQSAMTQAVLPGGPYEIWARWKPASATAEEAKAKALTALEKAQQEHDPELKTPGVQKAIESLKSGRPIMNYGTSGVPAAERN